MQGSIAANLCILSGVEAASVGSHNVFEPKSRTLDNVVIQNFSTIGAGCIAQPPAYWHLQQQESQVEDHIEDSERCYTFPSRSVVFGQNSQFRLWSGNGVRQADALHAKHLDYLRESKSYTSSLSISPAEMLSHSNTTISQATNDMSVDRYQLKISHTTMTSIADISYIFKQRSCRWLDWQWLPALSPLV